MSPSRTSLVTWLVSLAGLVALVLVAPGCGGGTGTSADSSQETGVIVEIDRDASTITSFSLETGEGLVTIAIDPEVDYGFDLEHLEEHRQTGEPVLCTVEDRRGRLYALAILDA